MLNFYHGTSENDLEKINLLGAEELFFTSCLSRAKQYSVDGVVLEIEKKFKFKYLNDAKKFCRDIIKMPFHDVIEKDVKPKKYQVKRYNPNSNSGREEMIYIVSDNGDHWYYTKPSPCYLHEVTENDKIYSHKYVKEVRKR